jgi:flavin reductase (DIM6/NTAB) family NADH-FMN oxidoreductase RutF
MMKAGLPRRNRPAAAAPSCFAPITRRHALGRDRSQTNATATSEVTLKEKLGATNALYPLVTAIVGATVDGKPDFATVAHVGIAHLKGITLGMGNVHLTNQGIIENETFSVSLPSEDMVVITDHIGMVSGKKEDKSGLFDLFYGELDTAPMIQQCKVTMECKLIEHVKLPTHDLFVGEIVGTYADVEVLTTASSTSPS